MKKGKATNAPACNVQKKTPGARPGEVQQGGEGDER